MAETGNDDDKNGPGGSGDDGIIILSEGGGTNSGSTKFTDPASASGGGSDSGRSSGPRRRGRPPGTGNKSKAQKSAKIDLGPFSSCVLGIHSMLATIAKVPELELDENEAEKLTKASAAVMKHYVDLDVTQKAADWTNLFLAIGGIYGPRFVAHKMRKSNEREARRSQPQNMAPSPAQPAGKGAPNVANTVVHFPIPTVAPATGGDFGGVGGRGDG